MNRKAAAWCCALLIIVQMVVGPVAHPMPAGLAMDECEAAAHAGDDCADRPSDTRHDADDPGHNHPLQPSGCSCACPCGHTPALAMPVMPVSRPALPEALASEPKGPAFAPPLFDFLRPPN
jgi:hypothetical protein